MMPRERFTTERTEITEKRKRKKEPMNNIQVLNQRYEAITWGAIFILLGFLMFIPGDQNNVFVLGIGIILLGLNLARSLTQIAVNRFTVIIGAMALVLGGLSLLWPMLGNGTRFDVDIFPFIILAIGLYLLIPGPKKETNG
jgi:hypothetical protein